MSAEIRDALFRKSDAIVSANWDAAGSPELLNKVVELEEDLEPHELENIVSEITGIIIDESQSQECRNEAETYQAECNELIKQL